jgi:hypothetical protein
LLPLLLFFHKAHFGSLIFLVLNHLLHALCFELFSTFCYAYHFFVLLTFLFQSFSFSVISLRLTHLLISNCFLLLHTKLLITKHLLSLFLFALLLKWHFVVKRFSVSLSYINNVVSFLFCFLNFFPGLDLYYFVNLPSALLTWVMQYDLQVVWHLLKHVCEILASLLKRRLILLCKVAVIFHILLRPVLRFLRLVISFLKRGPLGALIRNSKMAWATTLMVWPSSLKTRLSATPQ